MYTTATSQISNAYITPETVQYLEPINTHHTTTSYPTQHTTKYIIYTTPPTTKYTTKTTTTTTTTTTTPAKKKSKIKVYLNNNTDKPKYSRESVKYNPPPARPKYNPPEPTYGEPIGNTENDDAQCSSSVYTMFLLLPGYSEYSPPPFLRESSYNVPEYVKPETKYIAPASTSYLPPLKSSTTTPIPSYHHSLPTSLTPPELRGVGGSSGGVTNIYTTSSSDHVPTSTQATIIQTPPGTPIIINLNSNTDAAVSTKELMNMTNTGRAFWLLFMLDSMSIISGLLFSTVLPTLNFLIIKVGFEDVCKLYLH